MSRLKLKVNIKKIIYDFIKILVTVCCVFAVVKIFPSLAREENITKKTLPIVQTPTTEAKRGSIEVLSTGNSCLYSSLNPLQLWNDHGITSYVAASPKQNMSVSYYMIREILSVHDPKVLILETNAFFDKRGYDDESKNLDVVYKYAYPIFKYTNRWNEMIKNKYTQSTILGQKVVNRGFYYDNTVKSYDFGMSYMKKTETREQLSTNGQKYIPMIMDMAKQKGIKVLFVSFPSQTAWSYEKHNTTSDLAKQYGVDFIDYNVNDYGAGFDWKTDSRDGGNHLNYSGSKKMSKSIGEYLKNNFTLHDYRGQSNFSDWDKDYEKFIKTVN